MSIEKQRETQLGRCRHRRGRPVSGAGHGLHYSVVPGRPISGFTLIEILIAIVILLTIAALAIPNFLDAMERAKIARAVADIHTIGTAVLGFQAINGQCPGSLSQVGYGGNFDPWGRPYQYLSFTDANGVGGMRKDRFLVPINTYFDLYSMGKDGDSVPPLSAGVSKDDVIWANDGNFLGLASDY